MFGLTWLSRFDKQHGLYRFDLCLHEKIIQTTHVRRNKFSCHVCFSDKLKSKAEDVGLEWLINIRGHYGIYVHKICGKRIELQNTHVENKSFKCVECFHDRLKSQADIVGLVWIARTGKSAYSQYMVKDCGHFLNLSAQCVQKGRFECKQCRFEKLRDEAESVGLTLIAKTSKDYGMYRFSDCSHELEIPVSRVRNGRFSCQTCGNSWVTKPSNFYIILVSSQGESFVKVGISKDVSRRFTRYGLPDDSQVTVVKTIPFKTGRDAFSFEKAVKSRFKQNRTLSVNHIMRVSGGSECFSLSVLDDILDFVKSTAGVKLANLSTGGDQ